MANIWGLLLGTKKRFMTRRDVGGVEVWGWCGGSYLQLQKTRTEARTGDADVGGDGGGVMED
eukprot:82283-Chlamydomonas_euryale.AAC.1